MALSIPNRVKPGKDSFPTTPEAVGDWLAEIQPIRSIESARLLYRGIKHGNRLESSTRNRLEVAEILEPTVLETLALLQEHFFGHPLPLQRKQKNVRLLHESLLLEMAYSWKLVVNETYATLLPGQAKARSIGIYKSILTLAQLNEVHLNLHESVPKRVLEDLNTLYQFALKSHLTDKTLNENSRELRGEWSIENAYAYAITLTLINGHMQRRGQIPEICNYLAENIDSVSIHTTIPARKPGIFGLFLEHDGKPLPSQYTGEDTGIDKIHIDITSLLSRIDFSIEQDANKSASYPEVNSIDSVALSRLKRSFINEKKRSASRAITNREVSVRVGLMEVGVGALMADELDTEPQPKIQPKKSVHWPSEVPDTGSWTMINTSPNGACLRWKGRGTTNAEVGDLISLNPDPTDEDYSWSAAIVRWIRVPGEDQLLIGVETIRGDISAVRLTKAGTDSTQRSTSAPRLCLLIADDNSESSEPATTIVAPAGTFQQGDATEDDDLQVYQLISKDDTTAVIDLFTASRREILSNEEPSPQSGTET